MNRIATSPQLRTDLGENGYRAFVKWWSREAHMDLYFDFLKKLAIKKLGYVPWEREEGDGAIRCARDVMPGS
jgi:hypothetical protein